MCHKAGAADIFRQRLGVVLGRAPQKDQDRAAEQVSVDASAEP